MVKQNGLEATQHKKMVFISRVKPSANGQVYEI